MTLLEVKDLAVSFPTADGVVQAVRGVSFSVEAGPHARHRRRVGKRQDRPDPDPARAHPGRRQSRARPCSTGPTCSAMPEDQMRKIRGAQIAVIFQDPLTSLHPLYKVGWQIAEMIRAHDRTVSKKQATERAVDLLGRVGIPQPRQRVNDYPHQFSGGMRQRAMIAMALSLSPKLIIADEPTTALDATVQAQILDLLLRLQHESDTALIMITHDLGRGRRHRRRGDGDVRGPGGREGRPSTTSSTSRTTPTPRACWSRSRTARRPRTAQADHRPAAQPDQRCRPAARSTRGAPT